MRAILIAIIQFCFAIAPASGAETKRMTLHDAPRPLPEITFADDAGESLTLKSYRGKVVLLNTWATWCVPCSTEMPTLDRLQSRLGSNRFEVVALSMTVPASALFVNFVMRQHQASQARHRPKWSHYAGA